MTENERAGLAGYSPEETGEADQPCPFLVRGLRRSPGTVMVRFFNLSRGVRTFRVHFVEPGQVI